MWRIARTVQRPLRVFSRQVHKILNPKVSLEVVESLAGLSTRTLLKLNIYEISSCVSDLRIYCLGARLYFCFNSV